jgi:hypothetical protein
MVSEEGLGKEAARRIESIFVYSMKKAECKAGGRAVRTLKSLPSRMRDDQIRRTVGLSE